MEDNRLFICTSDPNNDGRFKGVIGDLEFWKNLNISWNETGDEEETFVKSLEGLDVLADMYSHYYMSITPADYPDVTEYIRKNIFPEESNEFLNCNKIRTR